MEHNRLFISNDCLGVLVQIANCMWVIDQDNQPTNDIRDEKKHHLLAALRYIGSDFTPEALIGDQRTRVSQKC